ncbi:hypothetical protein B1526_0478 [Bifidobacterium criceti]|uniref:Uncharacterized protein n=1 Tax=Bifidobacterium criceti TaxID=1960969 RepID=A0A2A2EGV1_9BIFI|nr:hypothetical protein B1526_0478 [Bifidobacterium criceti]
MHTTTKRAGGAVFIIHHARLRTHGGGSVTSYIAQPHHN